MTTTKLPDCDVCGTELSDETWETYDGEDWCLDCLNAHHPELFDEEGEMIED